MSDYTEELENKAYNIRPDDEDSYRSELMDVVKTFRTTGQSVTAFIEEHGFDGDPSNTEEMAAFIRKRFREYGIDEPRNLRRWFTGDTRIGKIPTGYQMCFVFGLDARESNEFLTKVCLEPGIEHHVIEEAVFYWSIRNKVTYDEARKIIEEIMKYKADTAFTTGNPEEVLYTSEIRKSLDSITSREQLREYLIDNLAQFRRNKVTATESIFRMWDDISCAGGLADREMKELMDPVIDTASKALPKTDKKRSTWEIFKQILDLNLKLDPESEKKRTIKPILKDNPLLAKVAEEDFPDRQGIEKIARKENVSSERIRKYLIFLAFYRFWVRKALENKSYSSQTGLLDQFRAQTDQLLIECGYSGLYYGNPFDWIFLFVSAGDEPLKEFRDYIQTLAEYKNMIEGASEKPNT